jgi:hypothetical protein
MAKETNEGTELIALASVYQDVGIVRGKIPTRVVSELRAKAGDILAFERQSNGTIIVRKSTATERKGRTSKRKQV